MGAKLRQNWPAAALLGALLLSVIPILLVGDCAHPYGDDYAFSEWIHHSAADGRTPLTALLYTVKRYYFGWQGTYAGTAVMALQPGLISEGAYLLTPVVLLSALILSTLALSHTLLRRWLGQGRGAWLGFAAGLLLVTIQFQPSPHQAFFWWNGSTYYTLFYCLTLLLACCLIRLQLNPGRPGLWLGVAVVLAAIIGGGNYVSGLFACLLTAGFVLLTLLRDKRKVWQPLLVELVLITGFLINALAPGNQVRQASSEGLGPVQAVLRSLTLAGEDMVGWFNLPTLALLILLIPLLWRAVGGTGFSFPLPGLAMVVIFLALACQNAPHLYALAAPGPGRLRNIVYDSYLWLTILCLGYWLGWLRRRLERQGRTPPPQLGRGLAALGLALGCIGFILTLPNTTSGQCVRALADGSARAYDAAVLEWDRILSDPASGPDVVVDALPVRPPLLYAFNLEEIPDSFPNIACANYYGKNTVRALPPNQE